MAMLRMRPDQFPIIRDSLDYAKFMLSIGLSGHEVVSYQSGDRPIFVFNTPGLVRSAFENTETYGVIEHKYREIADFYSIGAAPLLKLRQTANVPKEPYCEIQRAMQKTAPQVGNLLKEFARSKRPVEISHEMKRWMLQIMARILYDLDIADCADEFIERGNYIEEWLANVENAKHWVDRDEIELAVNQCESFFSNVAKRVTSAHEPSDVASNKASEWALDAVIRTLINAYNAAATSLSWTLLLLAQSQIQDDLFREAEKKVQGEFEFADVARAPLSRQIVLESLRLYPPAWLQGRRSIRDHVVNGIHIPEGSAVMVCAYALHRNPGYWRDPNKFEPERFRKTERLWNPDAYVPFGGGVHRCPAAGLSVPVLQLMVSWLVRRFHFSIVSHTLCRPRGLIGLRPHPGAWLWVEAR